MFAITLNRMTTPDHIFGPVSLKALKAEEYRRVTTGCLPDAEVAFLDEIFKANSAILNSLLSILNERKFENPQAVNVPLRVAVAASNEYPPETGMKLSLLFLCLTGELDALYDRFLLRFYMDQDAKNFSFVRQLVKNNNLVDDAKSVPNIKEAMKAVKENYHTVDIGEAVFSFMFLFWNRVMEMYTEQLSPRRITKMSRLVQVSQYTLSPF